MWDCNGWATCPVVLPYPATHSGPAQPFLLILLPRVACPCPSVCWRDRAGILVRNHAEHKDDPSAPSTRPFAQNGKGRATPKLFGRKGGPAPPHLYTERKGGPATKNAAVRLHTEGRENGASVLVKDSRDRSVYLKAHTVPQPVPPQSERLPPIFVVPYRSPFASRSSSPFGSPPSEPLKLCSRVNFPLGLSLYSTPLAPDPPY